MAKVRKTFNVQDFRVSINDTMGYLKTEKEKKLACAIIERVLMDTGNYAGFRHVTKDDPRNVGPDHPDYWNRFYLKR